MKSLLLITLTCLMSAAFAQEANPRNKAQYLLRITDYFDWGGENIEIGFIGKSEVANETIYLAEYKVDFLIRQLKENHLQESTECQLLYLPNESSHLLESVQNAAYGKPILIATDNEDLLSKGADIAFYTENNRLRFAINKKAIEESGVKMQSKLLAHAKVYQ